MKEAKQKIMGGRIHSDSIWRVFSPYGFTFANTRMARTKKALPHVRKDSITARQHQYLL
jgi:transposase